MWALHSKPWLKLLTVSSEHVGHAHVLVKLHVKWRSMSCWIDSVPSNKGWTLRKAWSTLVTLTYPHTEHTDFSKTCGQEVRNTPCGQHSSGHGSIQAAPVGQK